MQKEKKKVSVLIRMIRILSIIVIFICLYYIYLWYIDNKNTSKIMEDVLDSSEISYEEIHIENQIEKDIKTTVIDVDYDKLLDINSDTIGWLKIHGTDINYPVVQSKNNNFYLNHSFDKSYNKSGWIFADATNSNLKQEQLDKNTVIYGHNRQNNSMFGTLSNVFKEEWRQNKENQYINFSTVNKKMVWQVFSTYIINSEDYYIQTRFASYADYKKFLNTLRSRSIHDFNIDLTEDDKVLTLSTCTNIGEGRAVVHAKLIEIGR